MLNDTTVPTVIPSVTIMFDEICTMNEAFGNPAGVAIGDRDRLARQCKGIREEYGELQHALVEADRDGVEPVMDALCDILVFTYGAYHFMGTAPTDDFAPSLLRALRLKSQGLRAQIEQLELALRVGEDNDAVIVTVLDEILWLTLSYFEDMGWDVRTAMYRVFVSNMSKFCANDAEVEETIAKYAAIGVPVAASGNFPTVCVKVARECTMDGQTVWPGKFLKGVRFAKPSFADLV